jgi:hypothetical protein
MRDPYVPFFKDLLSSGVWFEDPAVRCVWIALVLNADAEGYVRMNLRALQREANVPLEDVKRALEIFAEPDPESRDQTLEGRRVVAVDRGWGLVTFEAHRRRARLAAEAARKARWDRAHRRAPSDSDADEPSDVGIRRLSDAQKQKPKQKQISKEGEGTTLPPVVTYPLSVLDGLAPLKGGPALTPGESGMLIPASNHQGQAIPATYHTLDGWEMSDEVRSSAIMAGVPDIDERVATARTLRIAAPHGTPDRDKWVRAQFPKWKRWREEDQAKKSFGRGPAEPPKPKPPRVKGCPPWVRESHEAACRAEGHDVRREAMAWAKGHHINPSTLDRNIAAAAFTDHLTKLFQKGAA